MNLKQQRDSFLGFAFAAADLLIEVDREGVILFALGATSPLGVASPSALIATPLHDLAADADRALLDHAVRIVRPGRRMGPTTLSSAATGKRFRLSGCALPNAPERRFFVASFDTPTAPKAAAAPRDEVTGLIRGEAFSESAADVLAEMKKDGRAASLTLLTIPNQADVLSELDPERATAFRGAVGAALRAASEGDAASEVADGRYSVIHDGAMDGGAIKKDMLEAARRAAPDVDVLVDAKTIGICESLSANDAARALVYTVNAYAEGRDDLDIGDLTQALDEMMRRTGERIQVLKSVISKNQVKFVAQPIVDLKSRAVSHYEMLARFKDGDSPFDTVTFAEKTGVIAEFDMSAIETAANFLAHSAPKNFPGLAVNVSGVSIINPSFAVRLFKRLSFIEFDRAKLSFEVTESAEITDLGQASESIRKVRKFGHKVYLDDFGAGASSFPYLRALDIDGVKIDGAYVREAITNRRDAALLKSIAGLCADLGMTTIAEMVESDDQVSHLTKLGVPKGQGFLFGRPVQLEELAKSAA